MAALDPTDHGEDPAAKRSTVNRSPDDSRERSKVASRIVGAVLVTMLAAVGLWLWREYDHAAFLEWKREAGPVPFFTALAILPAIGFPTTPFYILAGATFSPWVNVVGMSASLAANVVLCYWISHSGLKRVVEWALRRTRFSLPRYERKSAIRFALLVKMAPGVPTWAKNYLVGMSGVPFVVYFAICFGVTACYATAFVILGESLVERDVGMGSLSVAVFVVVGVVLYLARRRLLAKAKSRE
jgi:uncharacterized membrane protein YdjX (TVP38/TMEM64 family)